MNDLPLGKPTTYPTHYAPDELCAVPRENARHPLSLSAPLPFTGADIWNAWELSWLDDGGKPIVATATLTVDATSPNIVESKSLKLYLNSFAQTQYTSAADVQALIAADLSHITESHVSVHIDPLNAGDTKTVAELPGSNIDGVDAHDFPRKVDPQLLTADRENVVEETLNTHVLRSLCPVTGQPDTGSLLIRYKGPQIDRVNLLRYVVSFRTHNDFHETCVERMFVELKAQCGCEQLTVYARYNRRGGIDINPFRSDFETVIDNFRLWRQ